MKTRIKTHQMPGDVSKREKQAMLEDRPTSRGLNRKQRKNYKKWMLLSRERAVLKERTRHLIQNQ
jgi:hypothetical protein